MEVDIMESNAEKDVVSEKHRYFDDSKF